jgi:ubiquinone/menaquinone biosynthesis C-methylase UbiE
VTGSLKFDRVADRYDATRGGPERGVRVAANVAPHLAPGAVFEIGVGTGLVAAALRERGIATYGADLSPAMLARAIPRLPGGVVLADAHALPLAPASIPNVLFVHVLHLVGDLPAVIAEAARVLAPGGRIVAVHGSPEPLDHDDDDLTTTLEPLMALSNAARRDTLPEVLDAAAAAGLSCVAPAWTDTFTDSATPQEIISGITTKLWSYLWPLDDATWHSTVTPMVEALRALPDPNRPRYRTARMHLTVLAH